MDSPGYVKPAHQYGQPFGGTAEDENWAGAGYGRVPAPAELEPEDACGSQAA